MTTPVFNPPLIKSLLSVGAVVHWKNSGYHIVADASCSLGLAVKHHKGGYVGLLAEDLRDLACPTYPPSVQLMTGEVVPSRNWLPCRTPSGDLGYQCRVLRPNSKDPAVLCMGVTNGSVHFLPLGSTYRDSTRPELVYPPKPPRELTSFVLEITNFNEGPIGGHDEEGFDAIASVLEQVAEDIRLQPIKVGGYIVIRADNGNIIGKVSAKSVEV